MGDLTGVAVSEAQLPDRPDAVGYDNGPALLDFSYDDTRRLAEVTEWVVAQAARRNASWLGTDCTPDVRSAPACRTSGLAFAARAYRRELSSEETAGLEAVFDARVAEGMAPARAAATVAQAALSNPGFLYREELGAPVSGNGPRRLHSREIAESLAFFTTGGAPDEALVRASREGVLVDGTARRIEASRLLASPRGKAQLRAFLEQWLQANQVVHVAKDAAVYPEAVPELLSEMRRDLALTLDFELAKDASLASLLTTRVAFPGTRLAAVYGVGLAEPFGRVELDEATRAGVLTRAALLSVHSASDGSGPISRGLAVRASFLCATLPAPPPGVPRAVPSAKARTTRERFAEHTADPRCQGCHARIDGVGFGFEAYDGIGRFRTKEGDALVVDDGHLYDADVADGAFRGVPELERKLLASTALRTCFVTHALRYAFGSGENRSDEALVRELSSRFSVSAPLASLFADLAAHEAFVRRTSP